LSKKECGLLAGLAVALLCGAGLWVIAAPDAPIIYLGLGCTLAAGILLVWLYFTAREQRGEERRERKRELENLRRDHEEELTRLRGQSDAYRGTLSHSLRMPVAIIQGYADLLADGVVTDPDSVRDYLQKIRQRAQYITEVMSREFSDTETVDASQLTYSSFDLLELVRQAAADMKTSASDWTVNIQVIAPVDSLTMTADAHLLNRMLFNLLENSFKYMGRPGTVTIRVLPEDDAVTIIVQDDGLGLPSSEVEHIFERKYQGSNHVGGQGYGLYLVKRTVECHGGTVSANSTPGQGLRITMRLPTQPVELETEQEAALA
jgi:two-component system phosphate regulon sensor histidine kinase PhoR